VTRRVFGVAVACAVALLALAPGKTLAAGIEAAPEAYPDARRIVSIGGAVTEVLFALGLADRVIGIDLTSTYPPAARDKEQVGYMRALSAEGVLALTPDLVIAVEGSGPADAIEVLEKASVPFVLVPEAHDTAGVVAKIRLIAGLVGKEKEGEALASAVEEDLKSLEKIRGAIATHRKAIFVLGMSSGAPLVSGEHTAADGIFSLAGVDNALSGFSGYKPASDEAAMAAKPDAVVIMAERAHEMTPARIFAAPAFLGTPAARDQRLIALSGGYLLNFGPRTAHAARDLAAAVYPELNLPDITPRPWALPAPAPAHP
jgi:iron complex transport system substrate-binding protein